MHTELSSPASTTPVIWWAEPSEGFSSSDSSLLLPSSPFPSSPLPYWRNCSAHSVSWCVFRTRSGPDFTPLSFSFTAPQHSPLYTTGLLRASHRPGNVLPCNLHLVLLRTAVGNLWAPPSPGWWLWSAMGPHGSLVFPAVFSPSHTTPVHHQRCSDCSYPGSGALCSLWIASVSLGDDGGRMVGRNKPGVGILSVATGDT